MKKKLGLIVNPVAGMGGKVGLKGTDGPEILEKAKKMGAVPHAPGRAVQALEEIVSCKAQMELLCCPGEMGENEARMCGLSPRVVGDNGSVSTTGPEDTVNGAKSMLLEGIELLLFAGGDGTARDIYRAVGERLPVIGIPAGVKIHSAVFAVNPTRAGIIARDYLQDRITEFRLAEVMDIDETSFRQGRLSAELFGYLQVPRDDLQMQYLKAGTPFSEEASQQAVAEYIRERMEKDVLYLVGPGSSTGVLMQQMGLEYSLLGVDALCNQQLVGLDLNEKELLKLLEGKEAELIVTVIGKQGYIFGRGNQQLSADVINKVGRDHIIVIATREKIASLEGRPLLVDTGDARADQMLRGYIRVITGYREEVVYRVES